MSIRTAHLAAISLFVAACAPIDEGVTSATGAATQCPSVALECNGDGSIYRTASGGTTPVVVEDLASPLDLVLRSCTVNSDCGVAFLPLNKCGAQRAYGVRRSALANFSLSVDYCLSRYVGCSPVVSSIVTEDGRYALKAGLVSARCCAGRCVSYSGYTL